MRSNKIILERNAEGRRRMGKEQRMDGVRRNMISKLFTEDSEERYFWLSGISLG